MNTKNRMRMMWMAVIAVILLLAGGEARAATKAVGWGPSTAYVSANQVAVGLTSTRLTNDIVGGGGLDDWRFKPYSESTALNPAIGVNYADQGNAKYYGGVGYLFWDYLHGGSTMFTFSYNGVNDGGGGTDFIINSGRVLTLSNEMHLAIIWMKADFLNGLSALSALRLDSASTLTLVATQSGAVPIRFLVKNGTSYYVSQSTMSADGTLTVADPTTEQWAQLTMTGGDSNMWSWTIGAFGTVSFNDIRGIGYYAKGKPATSIAPVWKVTEFSAYMIDATPQVTIVGTVTNASESPVTNGVVSVERGSRTDGNLTVYYTIGGTATPGFGAGGDFTNSPAADYVNKTGAVTIADGQTNAYITICPTNDVEIEPVPETVILTLSNNAAYTVGAQSNVTLTITSDDVSGNQAPVVTNVGKNVTITMGEDGAAPTWVAATLYASDNEGDTLSWTNGAVLPQNGTVGVVNFVGSNLTSYTYTPYANFNGTNTFTMEVRDGTPGNMDACTVTVVVAAINDPPVTSAVPTMSSSPGTWLFTDTWTNNPGTWNDNADTNAVYTNATFQAEKTFLYQWQWSNSPAGTAIADATNAAFVPNNFGGYVGTNVRVRVWCVDSGVPGSVTSAPADSAWQNVFGAPVPAPVITNIGPLATTVSEDAASTDLQAVFSLLATNIAEAGTLTWSVGAAATQGTVNVSGGAAVGSSAPSTIMYQPTANRNGGDSFVLMVSNAVGGLTSNITVNITITAVNDAPTNTGAPGFTNTTATLLYNIPWTVTNGVWNDNADTNLTYTHAVFTNEAVFTYQWWQSDSAGGPSNLVGTAATYTPSQGEKYKYFNVGVTCTDSNYPTGNNQSNIAWTGWTQEKSVVPPVVTFTNALGDQAWVSYSNWAPQDVPTTNITAVIGSVGVLSPATVELTTGAQAAKNLYLGTNANSAGTLNMTGGTLTLPAAGKIVVAGATGSTGTLNQTGGSIGGITSGDLIVAAGNYSKGVLKIGGSGSVITSTWSVADGQYSDGTLTLSNAYWRQYLTAARTVGGAEGAIGRLNVQSNATMDFYDGSQRRNLTLGSAAGSTGIVEVTGNGVLTNVNTLSVGGLGGGVGQMTVSGSGKVIPSGMSSPGIDIGGTNNSSWVTVADSGYVQSLRNFGNAVGSVATLTLSNNAVALGNNSGTAGQYLSLGVASNSLGQININDNARLNIPPTRQFTIGYAAGSTGIVEMTGGMITNNATLTVGDAGYGSMTIGGSGTVLSATLNIGGNVNSEVTVAGSGLLSVITAANLGRAAGSTGLVKLQGGTWHGAGAANLGSVAGAKGEVQVTGGDWRQVGALDIGTVESATGLVTVANCRTATNITGAITVGGGATVGDRYGSITLTNATFGDGTRVMVLTNGLIAMDGTGSVFICNTFTNNGGFVTNHVRQVSGGLDITNRLSTSLGILNSGRIHLSFDENPVESGDFWGLRWAGTNGYPVLTNAVASGLITWTNNLTGFYSNATLTVYKKADNTCTYVGLNVPPLIDQGSSISSNMNEDGGLLQLTTLVLTATDDGIGGADVTWTKVTDPAHGTVSVSGTGTTSVVWGDFAYTLTDANWNGTDSFVVQATDMLGASNRITVSVVVDPVNDAPVNSGLPSVDNQGGAYDLEWSTTTGSWNDDADTNAVYDGAGLTFTYQWQVSNAVPPDVQDATNSTFTPGFDLIGSNVRVRVTCVDTGYLGSANAAAVSVWQTVLAATDFAPVITNPAGKNVTVNLNEDEPSGWPVTPQVIYAMDPETNALTWVNGSVLPQHGTVDVINVASSNLSSYAYYLTNANWNGTDTFTINVKDPGDNSDACTVTVVVAAMNDAPVNTAVPVISGSVTVGSNLTVTAGTWNDDLDTNVSGGSSTLTKSRQWKRNSSPSESGASDIDGATALTYTLTDLDRGKYIGVLETCVDTGIGGPGAMTNTVYSSWLQETSPVPGVVVFSNALDTAWGSYQNWKPTIVPTTNSTAVIGDTAVLSPATVELTTGAQAAKNLYLGTNANSQGTLNMTGGTLTFPAAGKIVVAGATGSTGTLNQTGGSIGGITSGDLSIAAGNNSKGVLNIGGSGSVITSTWSVAGGQYSDGTLTVSNMYWRQYLTDVRTVGSAEGALGRLNVQSNAIMDFFDGSNPRNLTLGSAAGSTGIVEVTGNGVITNVSILSVGGVGGGVGQMTVSGSGEVFLTGLSSGIDIGGTNNSSWVTVADSGYVQGLRNFGKAADSVATLTLSNNAVALGNNSATVGQFLSLGLTSNSLGRIYINDNASLIIPNNRPFTIGSAAGSTGIVAMTGGMITNGGGTITVGDAGYGGMTIGGSGAVYAATLNIGSAVDSEVTLAGSGLLRVTTAATLGAAAGGRGHVQITGGDWRQVGALNIGTVAGGTGLVTVANCTTATNITGAMTVGGGATAGDRYGSILLTNATFGGGTWVMVLTNGVVNMVGTGSVLRCNSFTNNGGAVTNYVRRFSGGVDVTNAAPASLVVTNGGKMHLVFAQRPAADGDFWGLRWNGSGHLAVLEGMTNSGALSWEDSVVGGKVGIYTNTTHTMVGFVATTVGSSFKLR